MPRRSYRRVLALSIVCAGALIVSACAQTNSTTSDESDTEKEHPKDDGASTGASAANTRADYRFPWKEHVAKSFVRRTLTQTWRVRSTVIGEIRESVTVAEITNADGVGFSIRLVDYDAEGGKLDERSSRLSWQELLQPTKTNRIPTEGLSVRDERITVPAGAFDCVRLTYNAGDSDAPLLQELWIDPKQPWLTIKATSRISESVTTSMELMSLSLPDTPTTYRQD